MGKRAVLIGTVVAVAAVAAALPAVLPTSADDYRSVAVRSAEQALAQVRTVGVAMRAELDGRLLDPYLSALLWQSRDTLSTAQQELASEEVPDEPSARLHDEVVALVADAVRDVGAAGAAVDSGDDAIRRVTADLDGLGDRLAQFVERNR